jgi:hypothetical protein
MSENINEQPVQNVEQVEQPDTEKKVHEPWALKLNLTKKDLDTKYFFKRIKAMEGVVKYDLSTWEHFPSDLTQAKELAKKITKDFSLNKKYSGYVVNVYFHLDKKTLRFETKKYQTLEVNNIVVEHITNDTELEKYLDDNLGAEDSIRVYEVSNYVFPEIETCKTNGKNLSAKFESINKSKKYIVFFNPKAKTVKITVKPRANKID